jgi:hypothetical protein
MRYTLIGFSEKERKFIQDILNDPRGWAGQGHQFQITKDRGKGTDVLIFKKSQVAMNKRFIRADLAGLSVCDRSLTPMEIWINNTNWNSPPIDFIGPKEMYRAYAIQHEIGHALGFDHHTPKADVSLPCPVMYQQTKGTKNVCQSNPWRAHEA